MHTSQQRQQRPVDRTYFGEALAHTFRWPRASLVDIARLQQFGIPVLASETDLADWLGISASRLRWFTHDTQEDSVWHYVRYTIPKRSGGERVILAPKRELKALQRRVLHGIVTKVLVQTASSSVHGFVKGRSITTNAQSHVGQCIVLSFDLKDFFQHIDARVVREIFVGIGFSYAVSSALTLLCTDYDRQKVDSNGVSVYLSSGSRHLPQGAPTSPALANLCASKLDGMFDEFAVERSLVYTRYADDITFSGEDVGSIRDFVKAVRKTVEKAGFELNLEKIRVARDSTRQVVTGLVVNNQVGTTRELRRKVRAILHKAQFTGIESQNLLKHRDFGTFLMGQIAYIGAARSEHAWPLRMQLDRLLQGERDTGDEAH